MKPLTLLFMFTLSSLLALAAPETASVENYKIPSSDDQYQKTKSWIEDSPDADYQHASAAAIEAFRDIKYGVRIHWGPYSINGQGNTSWPFLGLTYEQKQAYEEMYKTWNPTNFEAEEWMKLFKDNGLKMFAITANHHDGFIMYDTKTRVKKRVNWTAPGGPVLEDCDLASWKHLFTAMCLKSYATRVINTGSRLISTIHIPTGTMLITGPIVIILWPSRRQKSIPNFTATP